MSLKSVCIADANGPATFFTYDSFGRVTQTSFPSTLNETYAHDADNNLTSKTDRKCFPHGVFRNRYGAGARLLPNNFLGRLTKSCTREDEGGPCVTPFALAQSAKQIGWKIGIRWHTAGRFGSGARTPLAVPSELEREWGFPRESERAGAGLEEAQKFVRGG